MTARVAGHSWLIVSLLALACSSEVSTPPSAQLLVGLIPYSLGGDEFCTSAAERESAFFRMDDENDLPCTYETGDFGEGDWVSPQATKYAPRSPCTSGRFFTLLRFCRTRVSADAFRPLTTDPNARDQFYAVLRFGAACPAHSIEIEKTIMNEDRENANEPVHATALLTPNEITDDARGNYTRLFFCYFRAAAQEADTMREFPELGFPYAVFHDFDATQPDWVMQKRYQFSDDSNLAQPKNSYDPPPESSLETTEFLEIIENPRGPVSNDTYFDIARVR